MYQRKRTCICMLSLEAQCRGFLFSSPPFLCLSFPNPFPVQCVSSEIHNEWMKGWLCASWMASGSHGYGIPLDWLSSPYSSWGPWAHWGRAVLGEQLAPHPSDTPVLLPYCKSSTLLPFSPQYYHTPHHSFLVLSSSLYN